MPRLLVVQNDANKSLGRIADEAPPDLELDVQMSYNDLPDPVAYHGVVVLPGMADPVDDDPAIQRARHAIERALERELPVLGICLGGQLLAQVLGGEIYRSRPEAAYHEVQVTPATATDPLLAAAPLRFTVFHAHAFAFRPPAEAATLLENDVCCQAFRHGEAWAFQCHPEVRHAWAHDLAARIAGEDNDFDETTAAFFRNAGVRPDQLRTDANAASDTATRIARGIASGFAERCRSRAGLSG